MNGSWHLYRPGARWQRPRSAMRIVLETAEAVAVGFDVPVAEWLPAGSLGRQRDLARMGPDLLAPELDAAEAARRLRARADAEIGEALLDQSAIAGAGNVFKSEILFVAGVHPARRVRELSDAGTELLSCGTCLEFFDRRDRLAVGRQPNRIQLQLERLYGDATKLNQLVLRGLCFGIVDEADSVLVDEARTPLIISGAPNGDTVERQTYQIALRIAADMVAGRDFMETLGRIGLSLIIGPAVSLGLLVIGPAWVIGHWQLSPKSCFDRPTSFGK